MRKGKLRIVALAMTAVLGASSCVFAAEVDLPTLTEPNLPTSEQVKDVNEDSQDILPGKLPLQIDKKDTNISACVMVPMSKTAKALGFKVIKKKPGKKGEKRYYLDDGNMHTTITVGKNLYQVTTSIKDAVGMSAPFSLGMAPVISEGKVYVPVDLFYALLGCQEDNFLISGGKIAIRLAESAGK